MPEVIETIEIDAPPERVFAALADWESQGRWMLLTDVQAVGGPAAGVGTQVVARTGIPLPGGRHVGVRDTFVVTAWEPNRSIDVLHTGRVVRGPGRFEVRPRAGDTSTFVWSEQLELPLGALGRLGWPLVRPAMVAGVRLSLKRFAAYARDHRG